MVMKEPFEQVVAEHSATVLRVCRFVAGLNDADDAWTETFISAMRTYPDLPDNANVKAWLVTIAHNRSIDLVRSRQRRPTPVADLPEQAAPGSADGSEQEIWTHVRALPTRQRQSIAYHYLGGLPFKEIAEMLATTPEAARKAASDGVKALRGVINPHAHKEIA